MKKTWGRTRNWAEEVFSEIFYRNCLELENRDFDVGIFFSSKQGAPFHIFSYELKMEKVDIIHRINFTDKILQFSDTLLRKFMEKL